MRLLELIGGLLVAAIFAYGFIRLITDEINQRKEFNKWLEHQSAHNPNSAKQSEVINSTPENLENSEDS